MTCQTLHESFWEKFSGVFDTVLPSPHGISKTSKTPLLLPPHAPACKTLCSAKFALIQQWQRKAQIQAAFAAEEYHNEIHHYMHDMSIHFTFCLRPETLYLTLNIVDCYICRDMYDELVFIQMESHILSTIQWTLGHPTAKAWLCLMCVGPSVEDAKVQHVTRFLMEITLFYREFIKFSPFSITLAALTLTCFLCGKARRMWEETKDCYDIVDYLDTRLAKHVNDLSETLVKKYSYAFYSKAATFVLQHYWQGRHYECPPSFPITPKCSSMSAISTPMSALTTTLNQSDNFPITPMTPAFPAISTSFENSGSSLPEHFLPHNFVAFGCPALHNLSNISPQVAMVS
ncbi:hypothetical protein K438DRAFT_1911587 [Mycena galopus ATCC 62051]|nr:hypothetical protein K438DRAFT_1911587 [Mycena galopus ATCC 62051]